MSNLNNVVDCSVAFELSKNVLSTLVDVRSYEELEMLGSIPKSTHIPWYIWEEMFDFKISGYVPELIADEIKREKFKELVGLMRDTVWTDRKVYILCASGRRTNSIIDNIDKFNVSVFGINDGLTAWWANELPFEAVN